MAGKILERFKTKVGSMELVPSDGGCFELAVGDKLVFSKLKEARFPDEAWAVGAVGALLG